MNGPATLSTWAALSGLGLSCCSVEGWNDSSLVSRREDGWASRALMARARCGGEEREDSGVSDVEVLHQVSSCWHMLCRVRDAKRSDETKGPAPAAGAGQLERGKKAVRISEQFVPDQGVGCADLMSESRNGSLQEGSRDACIVSRGSRSRGPS